MRNRRPVLYALASAAAALPAVGAQAQDAPGGYIPASAPTGEDLSQYSIEELAQLPVRSASKREEPLSAAPTALFVITGADIARSAATSLPEVLRLAPNLQVQQVNAREYALSARGFNGYEPSNKLLVLIDGRSVYSTLHSGVFWELHSPLLEDIQQIEVISGPGGTLFGPNAVNGVINIASRDARETLGGLVRATAGSGERTMAARYGFALGDSGALRLYGTAFDREDLPDGRFGTVDDGIRGYQAGFRADFGSARDTFTVQGDIFDNETFALDGDGNRGGNLLARWSRRLGGNSSFRIQAYYDHFQRRFILVRDSLETFDVDAQVNADWGSHAVVAGLGVRTTRDEFINNLNFFHLDPTSRRLWIANAYVQDRFALSPTLSVVAGLKLERSPYTGIEVLPNLRLAWQPDDNSLFWAAVSRVVRTPSRIDRELTGLPILTAATDFQSEKLVSFEAGYRGQPSSATSLSISVYFNHYDDLRTAELTNGTAPARLSNNLTGHAYGLEAWGSVQILPAWRLRAGINLFDGDFRLHAGTADISGRASLGDNPSYQLLLRSAVDFTDSIHLDLGLRAIDSLTPSNTSAYVEADARLGWMLTDTLELYVAGNNLLHRTHAETSDPNRGQLAQRSVYGGARVRF